MKEIILYFNSPEDVLCHPLKDSFLNDYEIDKKDASKVNDTLNNRLKRDQQTFEEIENKWMENYNKELITWDEAWKNIKEEKKQFMRSIEI